MTQKSPLRKLTHPPRFSPFPEARVLTAVPTTPEALTVPEVMTALRLSRSKVYDLLRSNELPSITIGRARRIPVESVRAYMRDRLEEAA
jgi:excisionase family DNA binding protein